MSYPASQLTNQQFGMLRVLRRVGYDKASRRTTWECVCTCGNHITVTSHSLTSKRRGRQSCGCIQVGGIQPASLHNGS